MDVVVQPMPSMTPQCSQTGNCEPAQGGVKISTSEGPCSVGFKATYGGNTGFVTAGHCTDGNTGVGVGQPNYWSWDRIGTVTANSYNTGTSSDALFVDADEDISDKIYNNIDVNWAGNTGYLDGVTMEGHKTKGVFGVVVISSYSNFVGSVWVNDMAATNYAGEGGDSRGPVYGYIPSKKPIAVTTEQYQHTQNRQIHLVRFLVWSGNSTNLFFLKYRTAKPIIITINEQTNGSVCPT